MNIGDKIRNARKAKGLTQEQLGKHIGVQKSAIAKYETGRVVNIKRSSIQLLAEILDLDPSEFIFDEKVEKLDTYKIPIVGEVCAGDGILVDENIIEYTGINESMAKRGKFFGLQIKGDSMEPKIPDESIVIVRQQNNVENGEISIAYLRETDEGVCKTVYKKNGGVILQSINPKYDPLVFPKGEGVDIVGKVVECRTAVNEKED